MYPLLSTRGKCKTSVFGLLFLFLFIFSVTSNAVQGVKGLVKEEGSQKCLTGANIVVKNTTHGASSDTGGQFQIMGLLPGDYKLEISMMGYNDSEKSIKIVPDSVLTINVELLPTVLKMQSVYVIDKHERNIVTDPALESPGLDLSTSIIPRVEIKKLGAKTLIDAMKYVPGALIETRGRKVKQFYSVRGQRYPYPTYAIDGIWQKEFHETTYFFSAADIQSIKVIRSSAALLTGVTGMAGVIDIVPREYEKSETLSEIEYGSFDTYRAHLSHGSKIGALSYSTGLGIQHSDGPNGIHASESMTNFFGNLSYKPTEKLSVKASLYHLNGQRELAQAEPPAALKFQTFLQQYDPVFTTIFNFKGFYQTSSKTSTEFRFSYADRKPVFEIEDPETHEIVRNKEADHEWNINLIESISLFNDNFLCIGALYNRWVAPNGKRFYYGRPNDTEIFSGVIVDEHHFGKLSLDAGVRWEKTHLNEYGAFGIDGSAKGFSKVAPITDEWQPSTFTGSFGLAYYLTQNYSLHSNLASGSIKPTSGTLDTTFAEPENENQVKLDLGLCGRWEGFGQASVVGFFTQQKDAIVLSGQTYDSNDRIMELYMNRDQDQYGLEIEFRTFNILGNMELFLNSTLMYSRADQGSGKVRNEEIPSFILNAGVYKKWSGYDFNALCKYVSSFESIRFVASSKTNPAIPQPLGDFFTVDFVFGRTFQGMYPTRIYFEMKNVTDEKYSTVVGYPDYGRRITFGLSQTF